MDTQENKDSNGNSIARRWKVLSGEKNWEGLLDPLDYDLRRYIIHYGDMAQSTYDTFNSNKASKYAGNCIFSMDELFSNAGLQYDDNPFKYRVTKYLYATSSITMPDAFIFKSLSNEAWSKESNWIGYVAVATTDEGKVALGRRDIVIVWRGSVTTLEWINDFNFLLGLAPKIFGPESEARVHEGWYSIYTSDDSSSPYTKMSARDQVLAEVQRLVQLYQGEEISITITGHSLGAAVATLNAVDIVENKYNISQTHPQKACPVTTIIYASPRVGDDRFKEIFSNLDQLRILQIRNSLDVVPSYPLVGYTEVGEELEINTTTSRYLKSPGNFQTWHNLEGYIHGVAGTQGHGGGFELVINRDLALVNKSLDLLKAEYCVPVSWWCLKNKGMVQQQDGSWKLTDHLWDD